MSDGNCFEMSASLCRSMSLCSPVNLLSLMELRDLPAFKNSLKTFDSPNPWIGEPHLKSILDLACERDGASEFVLVLLQAGADPNTVNNIRRKAPIHFAAESANLEALEVLLNDPRTDINLIDDSGNTVLHRLAVQKFSSSVKECIKFLLKLTNLQTDKPNRKGKTAVNLAVDKDEKETVMLMLESGRVSVDNETYDGRKVRDVILQKMPELECLLPEPGIGKETDDVVSRLFSCLYRRDEIEFSSVLNDCLNYDEGKKVLNCHDGKFTLLQYAINNGMETVAEMLLKEGADPNATTPYKASLPSILAAGEGYYEIIKLLIEKEAEFISPIDGKTVLHVVIEGAELRPSNLSKYILCFDLILNKLVKCDRLDINAKCRLGNTALHIAARSGDKYFILKLMEHGAYIGTQNCFGDPPLANISSKILEQFLNECVTTNGKSPRDENYEIIFDYKFLAPPATVASSPIGSVSVPLDDPPLEPVPECQPLLYISRVPDLRRLLKHPIFTSFLELKWRGIRPFFYVNLTFYLIFVALMTLYILFVYEHSPDVDPNNVTGTPDTSTNSQNKASFIGQNKTSLDEANCVWSPGDGFWMILVFYFFCLVFRELFQLVVDPCHYIRSLENLMEILLIIFSGLVLFYRCVDSEKRPHLSAVTILLSWAELVLLIGRHPRLSTNIEMLKTVSMNFLQFLAWYSILIIAFALSFYTLFRRSKTDDNFFLEPETSLFKTVVMVTGEFDAGDLPFQSFAVTSHVIFVLFVFLVAIVLFNLLNGLAVSDTQAIKDDAELVGIVSRIKLVSYTESILLGHPFWCRRKTELDCCFFQALSCIRSLSFSRLPLLVGKVRLFPGIISSRTISVLPNQFYQILTASEETKLKLPKNEMCFEKCECYGNYRLDSRIVKDAVNVLTIRNHETDADRFRDMLERDLKHLIEAVENNSYQINNLEQRMEKLCVRTQLAVEEILRIMQKSPGRPFSP